MKPLNQVAKTYQVGNNRGHELQDTIPDECKSLVDQVFLQLAGIKPAWKHAWSGSTPEETTNKINTAKREWVKAFFENRIDTEGKIKNGLIEARRSNTDFLPSSGKFIAWCNLDNVMIERAKLALANFSSDNGVVDAVEKETRARCGYDARRLSPEKRDKLFLETYYNVYRNRPELVNAVLIPQQTEQEHRKTIFTRRENQLAINKAGISNLKKLFGD